VFTPQFYIDQFQSTKKLIVAQLYSNTEVRESLNNLIDTQTEVAKQWTSTTLLLAKTLNDSWFGSKSQ
jgi:hypothetical protein